MDDKLKNQYKMDHAVDAINYCVNDIITTQMYIQKSITIKNVIFNDPATIVFWEDGTKTIVKRSKDDIWDPEKGLAMAMVKKYFGHTNIIKKWTDGEVKEKNINKSLSVTKFITNVTYLKNYDLYTETIDKKE